MKKIQIIKNNKARIIRLSLVGLIFISLPTALHFSFPTWKENIVKDFSLGKDPGLGNLLGQTFIPTGTEANERVVFRIYEKKSETKPGVNEYTFRIYDDNIGHYVLFENSPLFIHPELSYSPKFTEGDIYHPPQGDWSPIELQWTNTGSDLRITWETSQNAKWIANFADPFNVGQVHSKSFYTNTNWHAPSYKFNLVRGEGNDNPDRNFLKEHQSGAFPTTWGNLDLIIDLREPYIHANRHINKSDFPEKGEYYYSKDWIIDLENEHKFEFEMEKLPVEIYIHDVNTLDRIYNNENVFKGKIDSYGNNSMTNNGFLADNVELIVENNGYTYMKVKDIITLSEDEFVKNKNDEEAFDVYWNVYEDLNGDGFFSQDETRKFYMNEGTAHTDWGSWVYKRPNNPRPPQEIGLWDENGYYFDFSTMPPTHISGVVLGAISLIWVPIELKSFLKDKK